VPAPIVLLAPGVYRIPTLGDYINSFAFLEDDGQVTLVDCGLSRAPARIVAALAGIGRHPSDVTRIILTHAHADHAGGAKQIVDQAAAEGVDVHAEDADDIRSGTIPPVAASTMGRLVARGPMSHFEPVAVSRELTDGEELEVGGGLRILHTPGHTPGHISLIHQTTGVLITGDVIFHMGWRDRMRWPVSAVCTNATLNRQSAHVLAETEYDIAAFTHGPEIRERAREQVRDFVRRKSA